MLEILGCHGFRVEGMNVSKRWHPAVSLGPWEILAIVGKPYKDGLRILPGTSTWGFPLPFGDSLNTDDRVLGSMHGNYQMKKHGKRSPSSCNAYMGCPGS